MYENPDENRQIHAKCTLFNFFSLFREFALTFENYPFLRKWYTFKSGVCVCVVVVVVVVGGGGGTMSTMASQITTYHDTTKNVLKK